MSDESEVAERPEMQARSRAGMPQIFDSWYIACRADELSQKPLGRTILGIPLVLFRAEGGRPTALLNRCAHRNVPLSAGKMKGGEIECPYHGWRFDGDGVCKLVPALLGPQEGKARRVPLYPTVEQQGYVWVYATPDVTPSREPHRFTYLDNPRYASVRFEIELESTVYNALENALDVPHTAFLHRGLFRGSGKTNRITAVVRRSSDRVEAEYVGEPVPGGLMGKLLAPQGGTVKHFDRFILPSIAEVEYGLGNFGHLLISDALTPVNDFTTRMYAVGSLPIPIAGGLVGKVLAPFAKLVVKQDAGILKLQSAVLRRFGGEQFVSTDVDVLGPHIARLIRQAERGESAGAVKETRVELMV